MYEKKYEKSCEMIYDMISKRVKTIRDSKGLTNVSIYAEDPSLISAIVNNRKYPNKNKYLIPDGKKTWSNSDPNAGRLIDTISDSLSLPSADVLILGSENEIQAYSGSLFRHLILDTLDSDDEKTKTKLEDLLMDYIPFAKSSAFIRLCVENDDIVMDFIDEKYRSDIDDYSIELDYSIARLYNIIKYDFADILREMFLHQANTIKLNRRFGELVSKKIIPYLIKERSEYSIGSDARDMLRKAYERLIEYYMYDLGRSPESYYYDIYDDIYSESDYLSDLIDTDIAYVDCLANIQLKAEGHPELDVFINQWDPSMCLN